MPGWRLAAHPPAHTPQRAHSFCHGPVKGSLLPKGLPPAPLMRLCLGRQAVRPRDRCRAAPGGPGLRPSDPRVIRPHGADQQYERNGQRGAQIAQEVGICARRLEPPHVTHIDLCQRSYCDCDPCTLELHGACLRTVLEFRTHAPDMKAVNDGGCGALQAPGKSPRGVSGLRGTAPQPSLVAR